MPADSQFITGSVPNEMREGLDLGVDIAPATEAVDIDGTPAQLTRVSFPKPAHIPPPVRIAPTGEERPLSEPRRSLRYDFPLFPDVQVHVEFQGNANADHLEQLTELLNVQCRKLREQEQRRVAAPSTRKIKAKKGTPSNE